MPDTKRYRSDDGVTRQLRRKVLDLLADGKSVASGHRRGRHVEPVADLDRAEALLPAQATILRTADAGVWFD